MSARPLLPAVPAALAAAWLLGACAGATEPADVIVAQERPFYYYQGAPVWLDVDSTRLTVQTTAPMPATAVDVLAPVGVGVAGASPLEQAGDHWVVQLAPGTSARAAVAAATALRAAPPVDFASNAYHVSGGDCSVLLVNLLVVEFKSTAPESEIAALNARIGTTTLPTMGPAAWRWMRYPAHSPYTPLEIAAYYDRHPLVSWADPDKIGCARPLD